MARRLTLFLIRHGETVDNVAQVYAGSRDSALTNHGYQQATRLGKHLSALGWSFTHIFSSPLQRAAQTASLIREAQLAPVADNGSPRAVPNVVELPVLMEQDFGSYEGKKFHERPPDNKMTGKDESFVDVESKESLAQRADTFIDSHLMPIMHGAPVDTQQVVAVVSHGIMLSTLWKRLLARLPPHSVSLSAELAATPRPSLEHLGGWSNTGYLELYMSHGGNAVAIPTGHESQGLQAEGTFSVVGGSAPTTNTTLAQTGAIKLAQGWLTVIESINCKAHLQTLKRTRGGVGSAPHDATQQSLDSFFKRRKVD